MNPADKAFSAFAWVSDGGPAQAIVSQTGQAGGSTWLGTDASAGKLMTGLMSPEPALQSEFVITNGQWHEIGLVWDGSRRTLYLDRAEVAEDTSDLTGVGLKGGLYFGIGEDLDAPSCFSGPLDDIRIYDRAIVP